MNVAHPNYGQNYRLMRAALRMGDFTVSELQSLTGAGENTVYSFIGDLEAAKAGYLHSKNLPSEGRGRPKKRYSITDAGVAFVTKRITELAPRFEDEPIFEVQPAEKANSPALDFDLIPGTAGVIAGLEAVPQMAAFIPPVNVYEYGEHGQNLLVQAEIPGVVKEDLDVLIDNNILVISGERKALPHFGKPRRMEVRSGAFRRSFILPSTVDPNSMRAQFENGVLRVLLVQPSKVHGHGRWIGTRAAERGSVFRASIEGRFHEFAADAGEFESHVVHEGARRNMKASSG